MLGVLRVNIHHVVSQGAGPNVEYMYGKVFQLTINVSVWPHAVYLHHSVLCGEHMICDSGYHGDTIRSLKF